MRFNAFPLPIGNRVKNVNYKFSGGLKNINGYNNLFKQSVTTAKPPDCKRPCLTRMIAYVCDSKGNTHSDQCHFENAKCDDPTLEKKHDGMCQAGICLRYVWFCNNHHINPYTLLQPSPYTVKIVPMWTPYIYKDAKCKMVPYTIIRYLRHWMDQRDNPANIFARILATPAIQPYQNQMQPSISF